MMLLRPVNVFNVVHRRIRNLPEREVADFTDYMYDVTVQVHASRHASLMHFKEPRFGGV